MSSRWSRQPPAHHAYGSVIYWLSLLASLICTIGPFAAILWPGNNYLNPHFLFYSIWRGRAPQQVWTEVGGQFPGAHFWTGRVSQGDGLVHLGIALGCASAAFAFLAAALAYLRGPRREPGWAALCLLSAAIILTASLGVIRVSE